MLFNSVHFLVFFPMVVAAYFSMPHRFRWAFLLAASCYFYMVFIPKYILILAALILIDYAAAIAIEETADAGRRKALLTASLLANVGMLGFFKYFNFASANLTALAHALGLGWSAPVLDVVLPIGLSFHTFQSMAYTIEVYRGAYKAERHLGVYAVYVLFFPQMVAGPIERPRLIRQIREEHEFDEKRLFDGLKLMTWGFIKKVVVADRLTLLVDHVYANPSAHGGPALLLATYFFAFQIYCDFSGYTDIALGAAQCLGFRLMQNFERPYYAKSIPEFWKRWHISLSSWFRDYLYIPLGGSRVPKWRWYANLMIVFLVSGLWHGANWTFLLWGGLHGSYMLLSEWTRGWRDAAAKFTRLEDFPGLRKAAQVGITFHLATLAWVAFRARTVGDVALILRRILDVPHWTRPADLGLGGRELFLAFAGIALVESVHLLQRGRRLREAVSALPSAARVPLYAAAVLTVLFFGKFSSQSFIYFQF